MYLLVDNYDSFTYNLYAMFANLGAKLDVIKNDEFRNPEKYDGIIISPGPSNPTNAGTSLRYLSEFTGKKPIFGVCLGMQVIGHAIGYTVDSAVRIRHGKVDEVKHDGRSVLFSGVPETFTAVRYHSLAVKTSDPIVTAVSATDGEVMAIEDVDRKIFGVQFHPESIRSEHGALIGKNFIEYCGRM